jgi:hypothetical protein
MYKNEKTAFSFLWTAIPRVAFFILLLASSGQLVRAQGAAKCDLAFDEVDPFDSLRTVGTKPIALGLMQPSLFEESDGPRLVEEAKALVMFSQNDSINSFFLTLFVPEYGFHKVETGFTVLAMLEDEEIIGFYNVPDEGVFDKEINMRVYQHTAVVSLDNFNRLVSRRIQVLRIEYKDHRRTIMLTEEQQKKLQKALICVGRAVGLYPLKP